MALPTKAKAIIRDGLKPLNRKVNAGQAIIHFKILRLGGATGHPLALFGKKYANCSDAKMDEIYKDDANYKAARGMGVPVRGVIRIVPGLEGKDEVQIVPSTKDNRVFAADAVIRHFKALKETLAKEAGVEVTPQITKIMQGKPSDAADVSTLVSSKENELDEVPVAPPPPASSSATDPETLQLAAEGQRIVLQIDDALARIPTLAPDRRDALRNDLSIAFDGLAEYQTRLARRKRALSGVLSRSSNAANIALLDQTGQGITAVEERLVQGIAALDDEAEDEAPELTLEIEASARVKNEQTIALRKTFNALVRRIGTFIARPRPEDDEPLEAWKAEGGGLESELAVVVADAEDLSRALSSKTFARARVSDSLGMVDEILARASVQGRALRGALEVRPMGPELPTGDDYRDALKAAGPIIGRAIRLTDIGGATVKRKFDRAEQQARAERWLSALALLDAASADAQIVVERETYVRAYNAHRYKIRAAMDVKQFVSGDAGETYGQVVKKRWDAAMKLAKPGTFEDAGVAIEALAKTVREVVDPAMAEIRAEIAAQKIELAGKLKRKTEALALLTAPTQKDLDELEALVTEELARGAREKAAGLDPTDELMTPLTDETELSDARALFVRYDWFELKSLLHDGTHTEAVQKKLWRFRQDYVTKLIDEVRKDFPDLIAKASGSTDLESDIDITFATPRAGDDVKAARQFNQAVAADFKRPPGRTFDVNIYIREYGTIKESFNEFHEPGAIQDENLSPQQDSDMARLTQVDQDVATLLKQRRFKTEVEFGLLMNALLAGIPDLGLRAEVQRRYEEAEANYFITLKAKLDGIERSLRAEVETAVEPALGRIQAGLKEIDRLRKIKSASKAQRGMQEVMASFERDFPAETMAVTDEMYLERMAILRENEARVRALEGPLEDAAAEHDGKTCEVAHEGLEHDAWRLARIAALKVQVKKDITTNIVFANEAYISEGAIEHVVMTGQGSLSPEEKTKKIREMSPSKLLQSTNEQLADFFKEMEKYVAETVEIYRKGDEVGCRRVQGEGYVHSSKYVSRLLDAGIALALKYEDDEAEPFTLAWISEIPKPRGEKVSEKLSGLKSDIDEQLLAMRKSSSLPATAKAEVAVRRLNALLNVTDIGEFTYLFQKLGTELNTRVRSRKDYQKTTEVEREKEAEYFALRERPLEERAMGTLQSVVPSGKTDRMAELSRALTDLRIDDGDALAEAWALADRGVSDLKESRDLDRLGQARQGVLGLKTFVSGLQRVNTEIHRVFTDHLEQLDEEIALATD